MPIVEDPNQKGDLVIEFDIEFPKYLNSDSKDFIKKALIPNAYKKEERQKRPAEQLKSSFFDD